MKNKQKKDKQSFTNKAETITLLAFSGVFLLMMLMEMISHYEPRKLALLLFALWWMPLVLLHEFGHAVVANRLGWKVNKTVVGFGKLLVTWRLFKAPLEIRIFPIEGFVQMSPLHSQSTRLQNALIALAGPGIELLLVALIIGFLGLDQLFLLVDDYFIISIQSLVFAALTGAIINLIPMEVKVEDGYVPNDGMIIVRCLFQNELAYQKTINSDSEKQDKKG